MATKAKQPVKVYSFSLPPDMHDKLAECAMLMGHTKSKFLADLLEEMMPSLIELAELVKAAKAGKLSPTALAASVMRATVQPVAELQLSLAEALEASEGAHGTRSVTGVTEAEIAPYLRNRNKSGQVAQKTSKAGGKGSARGRAKP